MVFIYGINFYSGLNITNYVSAAKYLINYLLHISLLLTVYNFFYSYFVSNEVFNGFLALILKP